MPTGGGTPLAIAIVDAYDNPDARSDLTAFSSQFGLPAPTTTTFKIVYAANSVPRPNAGWALKSSLDIEWAHAMSPHATIFLVEARSNSDTDLLAAVDVATKLVSGAGGGIVSMSWAGGDFNGETSFDSHFSNAAYKNVAYIASSGDAPGVNWPSVSQYVIAAGGTSIGRVASGAHIGNFQNEVTWQSTGGGLSAYVRIPSYQSGISGSSAPGAACRTSPPMPILTPACGSTPNMEPASAATPTGALSGYERLFAGIGRILSWKGVKITSIQQVLNAIYRGTTEPKTGYRDITSGTCGPKRATPPSRAGICARAGKS